MHTENVHVVHCAMHYSLHRLLYYTVIYCSTSSILFEQSYWVKCQIRLGVKKSSTSCLSRPLHTNSLPQKHKLTNSNTQNLLPSCSAWLHISPLRRFLNTSCTPIREKRSRRRRSSALFIPSDYQSLSLSLPRLGRKDSATRPAICQSGPGGYAWLCPGRTACRRADVDERKRYAN